MMLGDTTTIANLEARLFVLLDELGPLQAEYENYKNTGEARIADAVYRSGSGSSAANEQRNFWNPRIKVRLQAVQAKEGEIARIRAMIAEAEAYQLAIQRETEARLISEGMDPAIASEQASLIAAQTSPTASSLEQVLGIQEGEGFDLKTIAIVGAAGLALFFIVKQVMK